jgi:hypothetical protein
MYAEWVARGKDCERVGLHMKTFQWEIITTQSYLSRGKGTERDDGQQEKDSVWHVPEWSTPDIETAFFEFFYFSSVSTTIY